jgi:hypothetical protein
MPRARLKKLPIPLIAASPAVIADLLSVRPDDIARWVQQGLPSYHVGMRRRIFLEDARNFLRSQPRTKVKEISHAV